MTLLGRAPGVRISKCKPGGSGRHITAEAISDKLVAVGLMNMGVHLLPHRKPWLKDRSMWIIQRDGQEVRSRTDYILGTDRRLFQDVAAWDTRQYLGHYMVLGSLRGEPEKDLVG